MKKTFYIILLLLSFISCETKEEHPLSPEFEELSALIQTDPETALSKLQNLSNSATWQLSSLEYSILLAEALYKNYLPQSNFDDIKAIVDYIETEKTTPNYLRAKAHYYHAVGLTERDDIAGTCEHYLKALEIMEEELDIIEKRSRHFCELSHSDYEKIRFISLTYTRLGNLFYNESYCDLSMHKYKKALKYSELIKDTFAQSHIFKLLGNTYHILGKNDSALYYYNESIKTDFNPINRLDVEKTIATVLYANGEKDSAYSILRNNLDKIENYRTKDSYYCILGNMYYQDKEYDSAINYLNISFESTIFSTKISSAVMLSAIYDSIGNHNQKDFYNSIISQLSTKDANRRIKSAKLQNIYDEYKERKYEREKLNNKNSYIYSTIAIIIVIIILTVVSIFRNKQKNIRFSNLLKDKENIIKQISKEIQQKENYIKSLEFKHEVKESFDNSLKERLNIIRKVNIFERNNKSSKNIKEIKEYTYGSPYKTAFEASVDVIESSYNKITTFIKESYPELNETEYKICILSITSLSTGDIANIVELGSDSVRKSRSNIRKKLHIEEKKTSISGYILEKYYHWL